MSDIRVGDQIRLSTYEGYVGFGTPEARSVYRTRHEGVVLSTDHSERFGRSVVLDCSVQHDDHSETETHYLEDFEVERLNVVTCTSCDGRGAIQVAFAPPTADADRVTQPRADLSSAKNARLRAEDRVEQVLRDHGIDPIQKLDVPGAPWLATLLVRAARHASDTSTDDPRSTHE